MMNLLDESDHEKLVNYLIDDPVLLLVKAAHTLFHRLRPSLDL